MVLIFQKYKLPFESDDFLGDIPSNRIGIDLGQTLTKITYCFEKQLFMYIHPTENKSAYLKDFLTQNHLDGKKINITGGKGYNFQKALDEKFDFSLFGEFEANVKGIEFLYRMKKHKAIPSCLITTIGTGTSMILKKDHYEHIGGTALGGGFFMALIKILYNIESFNDAILLAAKGNRFNVDLKVADIYSPEDTRVNALFRQFTAASLGKIGAPFKSTDYEKEDLLNSLICLIGENIGTIAIERANLHDINDLVFCGGFLNYNKPMQKILSQICLFNKKKAIFLEHSIFAGALGMLLV
ncbi:MAG: hypothetical protein EU532_14510 [Promethearchaeota archaeon]|nr:MAG: hypothetical protein EU532_14510 [Candidatus Lokiarchaeota archaeon]